jgi:hypothetical protein
VIIVGGLIALFVALFVTYAQRDFMQTCLFYQTPYLWMVFSIVSDKRCNLFTLSFILFFLLFLFRFCSESESVVPFSVSFVLLQLSATVFVKRLASLLLKAVTNISWKE